MLLRDDNLQRRQLFKGANGFGRPGGLELASIPNDTRCLRVKTWKIAMEIGNRQAASLAALEGKGPAVKLAGDRY